MAQSNSGSSRIEGIVTKDGVRNFGSNGHGFTLVPYAGAEKPKEGQTKGDPRDPVYFDVAIFGELPDGVVAGARVAASGYVSKETFTRKDTTQGDRPKLKAFTVEVLDPQAQTNVVLAGRVGKDGTKALGTGKTFNMLPYAGKDKEGNYLPTLFTDVLMFGTAVVDAPAGATVKVTGTMSATKFTRRNGETGHGYELRAKTVEIIEGARPSAGGAPAEDGSGLQYEDVPVF